jgi:hypothetical protein
MQNASPGLRPGNKKKGKKMKTQITDAVMLTDEHSASANGIPVMLANFPGGEKVLGPADKLPWGTRADIWLANLSGGGVKSWLESARKRSPQIDLFLRAGQLSETELLG